MNYSIGYLVVGKLQVTSYKIINYKIITINYEYSILNTKE